MNVEVEELVIDAIVDTGSNFSLISKQTFEKLGISQTPIDVVKLQTASKEIIQSTSKIKSHITFNEIQNANFNIEMLIVDKLPVEMILGNDFLLNNEAIINFTEQNIQLSGLIVNFESKNKLKNKNDNKTLCNYEENDIKNYINSISKFKKLGSYSKENIKFTCLINLKFYLNNTQYNLI
ncbi:hypothetical protein DMUE_4726 [Dictyocoela muelleri]|nr:hypothetical protein DMUE_4726 [Dictyocoela muelleri]